MGKREKRGEREKKREGGGGEKRRDKRLEGRKKRENILKNSQYLSITHTLHIIYM